MARKPRFDLPGFPRHVIQRGNNRQACFFYAEDYRYYLMLLEAAALACSCDVHAYVLMTNHVHLLVTPQEEHALPRLMQRAGSRYVQYVNRKYQRTGTLWEGRYKSCLVAQDRYLLTCYRYIELNPVRAGMTEQPEGYDYSSFRTNAFGMESPLLTPHPVYSGLGLSDATRCRAYRALFVDSMPGTQLEAIRDGLNRELVYGNERFKSEIEAVSLRQVRRGRAGRPRLDDQNKLY
jgi:putative transposase